MKDREDFFFRLSVVLGFLSVVLFVALLTGCCSTSSVEIVREVSSVGIS